MHYKTADTDIQHSIQNITKIQHTVLTGDENAHPTLWHSYTVDHRGQLIADVISNSDHITLNTPTRVPNTTLQHTSPPDITTVSNTLYNRTSWTTEHALSSNYLPIMTTINIQHDYRLQQNRRTFTNYKKADWTQFMEDIESAIAQTTIPTNIHTANIIFTNIILKADKHNISKGKMHSNCRILPDHIVCTITQRNNIRRANTCDPALKLLNEEITSRHTKTQTKPMEETLRCTLGSQTQYAHSLEDHTWSIQHSTSTHTKHIHNIQQQNSNHTQSKKNNSQSPDKLNTRHLKHIGLLGLAFLTSMLKTALNTNIIPHIWKLANIVTIPKPNKDIDKGTSYRPISLLSVIADTGEEPSSLNKCKHTKHSHATWVQNTTLYSDGTTHSKQHRNKGVQPNGSPPQTITVALYMSKAFDTINIHTLIRKQLQTNIAGTIIKFTANYIKGCKAYTTLRNHTSSQRQFKPGVPKGAMFHQHYSTYTLQTYHHQEHQFRS